MRTNLKVQSKYRMGYFATLQGEIERFKMKLREVVNEMSNKTDIEKTVRDHSLCCLDEFNQVSYLVANLRTDGPAKALIMVTRHGEAIDILNGKIIDENKVINQIIDNLKSK